MKRALLGRIHALTLAVVAGAGATSSRRIQWIARARRRFDTDRIVANRRACFVREQDLSVYVGPLEHDNHTL